MNGMGRYRSAVILVALGMGALMVGTPPTPALAQQQSVTQYEQGRQALNQAQYARAADLFVAYRQAQPNGRYAAESMYWQGFALSRMDASASLRSAATVLQQYAETYPSASAAQDAEALLARVHGELARRGDSQSARWVLQNTEQAQQNQDARSVEEKMAVLGALMNMDSDRAKPILLRVARDVDNHPELRNQALFMLSQYDDADIAGVMLDVARSDADPEVRQQAVFWLSQSGSDEALPVLEEILESPSDAALHEQALFAVSQIDDPRAREIIRDFARSESANPEMRRNAIFWIGQDESPESAAFLRDMWATSSDPEIRESVLFSLSQMDGATNADWLMDIALDTSENVEVRKQALFMASQRDDVRAEDLASLYDRAPDRDVRMQTLFVLSQSDDPAAFDKIIEVATGDDDAELRQNAIFWLGQSEDPRAEQALLDILDQ